MRCEPADHARRGQVEEGVDASRPPAIPPSVALDERHGSQPEQERPQERATRLEEFQASSHGRDQQAEAELALDSDARLLAMRVRIAGSIGAYGHAAGVPIHLAVGPKVTTGVYDIPVLDLQVKVVLTHKKVSGSPQWTAYLSAWNFSPQLQDSLFVFVPPEGAEQIKFVPAGTQGAKIKSDKKKRGGKS